MNCPFCKTELEDVVYVDSDDGTTRQAKFNCENCGNRGYIGLGDKVET